MTDIAIISGLPILNTLIQFSMQCQTLPNLVFRPSFATGITIVTETKPHFVVQNSTASLMKISYSFREVLEFAVVREFQNLKSYNSDQHRM